MICCVVCLLRVIYIEKCTIVDSEMIFEMISKEQFVVFNNEKNSDRCLDIEEKSLIKFTDEEAQRIIEKISKCSNVSEFQLLDIKLRDKYLKNLEKKDCL